MHPLSDKLIRLVGRYWEDGKSYKVRLGASVAGRSGQVEIKVVEPEKLGGKYGKTKDVFKDSVDMDSVIIANAGKYGIPPQILKAHIDEEVRTKEFGGEIGTGFTPGYLYEPYRTELLLRNSEEDFTLKERWENNQFRVSENDMGAGSVPDHKYTQFISYPQKQKTIWDMVREYSHIDTYPSPGGVRLYAKRINNTRKLTFYDYDAPTKLYRKIIKVFDQSLSGDSLYIEANDSLATYMKNEWRGGLKNYCAQTRMASSYGYFQITYPTALDPVKYGGLGYSETKLPEKINEVNTNFKLAMKFYENMLDFSNSKSWEQGYEAEWIRIVSEWNERTNYENDVFKDISKFKPQK